MTNNINPVMTLRSYSDRLSDCQSYGKKTFIEELATVFPDEKNLAGFSCNDCIKYFNNMKGKN